MGLHSVPTDQEAALFSSRAGGRGLGVGCALREQGQVGLSSVLGQVGPATAYQCRRWAVGEGLHGPW